MCSSDSIPYWRELTIQLFYLLIDVPNKKAKLLSISVLQAFDPGTRSSLGLILFN